MVRRGLVYPHGKIVIRHSFLLIKLQLNWNIISKSKYAVSVFIRLRELTQLIVLVQEKRKNDFLRKFPEIFGDFGYQYFAVPAHPRVWLSSWRFRHPNLRPRCRIIVQSEIGRDGALSKISIARRSARGEKVGSPSRTYRSRMKARS